jgi:hypothetical protein
VYPERLTPKQREAAVRHLAEIPDGQRQAVLDELEGRLRAERHGAKPVYDELSYLRVVRRALQATGLMLSETTDSFLTSSQITALSLTRSPAHQLTSSPAHGSQFTCSG